MDGALETEVKIRLADRHKMLALLLHTGFRESVARVFEANVLYDRNDQELRIAGKALRLRQAGAASILTFKGPVAAGTSHKTREELETTLGSVEIAAQILNRLGYLPLFRYEKYRTEYRQPEGNGVVTFDETPIGDFLELEGTPDWIDQTAETLGLSPSDYVLDSYGKLYLNECERLGVEPAHMVFPS